MTGATFFAVMSRVVSVGFIVGLASGAAIAAGANAGDGKISECVSGPKGTAPPGERWYYRVERNTKRHCWYTRSESPRRVVEQRPQPDKPAKVLDLLDPPPLQLSVANARAEADLSVPQPPEPPASDPSPPAETKIPTWRLAERWSNNSDAGPSTALLPVQVARLLAPIPAETPETVEDFFQDRFVALAAGAVALLGLSALLISTLVARRRRKRQAGTWHFAQRGVYGTGVRPLLTDLNDEPLMTWRKGPKDEVRTARQTAEPRRGTTMYDEIFSPTGAATLRQMPTVPPVARA